MILLKLIFNLSYIEIIKGEVFMAKIITEKDCLRRTIRLSCDDVISIVREYQQLMKGCEFDNAREVLENKVFYLPEDI